MLTTTRVSGPPQQRIERHGHPVGGGVAHDQRHQGEVVEDGLEERKLDLEAVFEFVRGIVHGHLGGAQHPIAPLGIEGDETERGRPGVGAAHPDAPQRHPVTGAPAARPAGSGPPGATRRYPEAAIGPE